MDAACAYAHRLPCLLPRYPKTFSGDTGRFFGWPQRADLTTTTRDSPMTQFQTVQIQGKGLFSKKMTLTLTDKWLIVRDRFGGEMMRLSPSQANMRVVAMGCNFLLAAIASFILALATLGLAIVAIAEFGDFIFGICPLLMCVVSIYTGISAWRMRNCRQLFLTPDVTQFFFVKSEEVPKLFQMMEMVENWTANK